MKVQLRAIGNVARAIPAVDLGEFDVDAVPRIGEYIIWRDGWASTDVVYIQHNFYDNTVIVEIPPDYTGEYREAVKETP